MPSVSVSFIRGLYEFHAAEGQQWTVGMLRAAVQTEYDPEVSIHDRPRPPSIWTSKFVNGKVFGFTAEYRSPNIEDYDALLADDTELAIGTKVYLVTGQAAPVAAPAADGPAATMDVTITWASYLTRGVNVPLR